MLIVLHGEDVNASYKRLQDISLSYKDYEKVRLDAENSQMFYQYVFGQDILGVKKLIIAQDLLLTKKVGVKDLEGIPEDKPLLFWETKELALSILNKLPKAATVEIFKPNPFLFKFLDTIGASPKITIGLLQKVSKDQGGLIWQLENRLFLLVLAKLGFNLNQVCQITNRRILDWQWQKIIAQAQTLSLSTLKAVFAAALKIETMIKTGESAHDEKSLISLMLAKHFQS